MGRRLFRGMLLILFLILEALCLQEILRERSSVSFLKEDTLLGEAFRRQELPPELYRDLRRRAGEEKGFSELLTSTMALGEFAPDRIREGTAAFLKYKREEYRLLGSAYEAIWSGVEAFPVASKEISFQDTFLAKRSYGGDRLHEGTDLFGKREEPGYYPIVSMTDGEVEEVGWLPLGGWRIGIRSRAGGYFYYAHLSGYDQEFQRGQMVRAGDVLGYMGNSGYGEEGTVGRFPVHLHLGIYITTPQREELSVNPYWVLRAAAYMQNIKIL